MLFAPSGVGKSSLLRAGVACQIRELAQHNIARRGSPRYVPVVFKDWKDNPLEGLTSAISSALEPFLAEGQSARPAGEGLREVIESASGLLDAKLLIILDQFEEYFLYQAEGHAHGFADELAECVNRADLRANFLIAIREDALALLGDLFVGKVANVYNNYLQLEYLGRDAARETIVKPIEHFNELHPGEEPVTIEPELVERVLDQVRTGEVIVAEGGEGKADGGEGNGAAPRSGQVETPYLQLVMSTLWAHARRSRALRLAMLEELGGAQEIVRTHLDGALAALAEDQREAAVDMFRLLVTPSGTKIVYAASDLAATIERPGTVVAGVLKALDAKRIVRHVPPPAGRQLPDDRYEIFHDVLAPAIVDWRRRALEQRKRAEDARERERLEREKHAAEERARRDRRQSRVLMAALALVVAVGVAAFFLWRSAVADRNTAQSRQLAASALEELQSEPQLSTQLALEALRKSHTEQAQAALRSALPMLALRRTLVPPASVTGAAYSPDGKLIVTSDSDGFARIWDASDGHQLGVLGSGGQGLGTAAFSPDGRLIATGGEDGTVTIWSVSKRRPVGAEVQQPLHSSVKDVAFSPDGARLLTAADDGGVYIWNARSARHGKERELEEPKDFPANGAEFSAGGRLIVTAGGDGDVRVWDAARDSKVPLRTIGLRPHAVLSAAISRDERRIVAGDIDGSVTLWENSGAKPRKLARYPGVSKDVMQSVAFSPDGEQVVAGGNDGVARVLDGHSLHLVHQLSARDGHDALTAVAFASSGRFVLTASADGTARTWSATGARATGVLLRVSSGDALERGAFSQDGRRYAVAGADGSATVWEVPSGRKLAVVRQPGGAGLRAVAFAPGNSNELVTGAEDGSVYGWSISNGVAGQLLSLPEGVQALAFSADGRYVAVAAGERAYVFDWRSGSRLAVHSASQNITDVSFSTDGTEVATTSNDGFARVYKTSGAAIGRIEEPGRVAIESVRFQQHADDVLLTASDDGSARMWSVHKHAPIGDPMTEPGDAILRDAEFNPSGTQVLTVSTDGSARVWDAGSRRLLLSLLGHQGRVISGAFSPRPEADLIATSSSDGTVKLWFARPREQLGAGLPVVSTDITSVAFSPDGQDVLTAEATTARAWGYRDHKQIGLVGKEGRGQETLQTAAFSASAQLIVTAGQSGVARVWKDWRGSGAHAATQLAELRSGSKLLDAQFDPHDARRLVTASESGFADVWQAASTDWKSPSQAGVIVSPTGGFTSASFSPRGGEILTTDTDGSARIWSRWSHGEEAQSAVFSEPGGDVLNDGAFSPDGRLVATASNDGAARVWNVATRSQEEVLREAGHAPVNSVEFSRDGSELLTASGDGTARVWAWKTGQMLAEFRVGDAVQDAAFSPNGNEIVTGADGGAAQVWSAELADPLAAIERIGRARVPGSLTSAQRAAFGVG